MKIFLLVIIVCIILILFLYQRKETEYFGNTIINNEALANLSSMYQENILNVDGIKSLTTDVIDIKPNLKTNNIFGKSIYSKDILSETVNASNINTNNMDISNNLNVIGQMNIQGNLNAHNIDGSNIIANSSIVTTSLCFDTARTQCLTSSNFNDLINLNNYLLGQSQRMYNNNMFNGLQNYITYDVSSAYYKNIISVASTSTTPLTYDVTGYLTKYPTYPKDASGLPKYDASSYFLNKSKWNNSYMIKYGKNNEKNGDGVLINIPDNYSVVWLRVPNDRWTFVTYVYANDSAKKPYGTYVAGYENLNNISPDGSVSTSTINPIKNTQFLIWIPIPLLNPINNNNNSKTTKNAIIVSSFNNNYGTTDNFWLTDIGFSTNPWNHIKNPGYAYYTSTDVDTNGNSLVGVSVNGKLNNIGSWNGDWNYEPWWGIESKKILTVSVKVIPSNRDKLLYFVVKNSAEGDTSMIGDLKIAITTTDSTGNYKTETDIERPSPSYSNPFAVHYNSRVYTRYIASKIKATTIGHAISFSLTIDMTNINQTLWVAEIGTHDVLPY